VQREEEAGGEVRPPASSERFFPTLIAEPANPVKLQPVPQPSGPGRLRVLVVDDSAVIRTVVAAMLDHIGAICDLATSGRDAVSAAKRERYDVVLMDVRMPGIDGPQAARLILGDAPPGRRPRIIGVTAAPDAALREACLRAGMVRVIVKPVRMSDLAPLLTPATGT